MQYQKHYDKLIKTRMPLQPQRIIDRKNKLKYYESHHIIPSSFGGNDEQSNLILLTFKEHFLAHILIYKMCKQLNFNVKKAFGALTNMSKCFGNKPDCIKTQFLLSSRKYSSYKTSYWENYTPEQHHMYGKTHTDTVKAILSKARIGKMPVKDAITGEIIGSMPVDHPKILDGTWIHTTRGRKVSDEEKRKRGSQAGSKNSNYREMTDDRKLRVFNVILKSIVDEIYVSKTKLLEELRKEFTEFKRINVTWLSNHFGSLKNLLIDVNKHFNLQLQYMGYYRSKNQKLLMTKNGKNQRWVTKNGKNIRIKADELQNYLDKGFKRGRVI